MPYARVLFFLESTHAVWLTSLKEPLYQRLQSWHLLSNSQFLPVKALEYRFIIICCLCVLTCAKSKFIASVLKYNVGISLIYSVGTRPVLTGPAGFLDSWGCCRTAPKTDRHYPVFRPLYGPMCCIFNVRLCVMSRGLVTSDANKELFKQETCAFMFLCSAFATLGKPQSQTLLNSCIFM